jgi:hypothetical protein
MSLAGPVAIELDANDPLLDDHRPGGLPLFGTALSIETLCNAVLLAGPTGDIAAIEEIEVCKPCILDTGARRHIFTALGPVTQDAQGRRVVARLLSPAESGGEQLHLRSQFRLDPTVAWPVAQQDVATMMDQVTGRDIYAAYFHGPSFQVISAAQFRDGAVTSRLSTSPAVAALPVIARLIEFALQSAGLLELAQTGRMMIPHAIGTIYVGRAAVTGPAYAMARRCSPAADEGDIDITVVDGLGATLAVIQRYQTTPLPFTSSSSAVAMLAGRLNAH